MGISIVTRREMSDIRGGKGLPKIERQKVKPTAKKSERMELIDTLNKSRIDFKGNASNAELRKLVMEIK